MKYSWAFWRSSRTVLLSVSRARETVFLGNSGSVSSIHSSTPDQKSPVFQGLRWWKGRTLRVVEWKNIWKTQSQTDGVWMWRSHISQTARDLPAISEQVAEMASLLRNHRCERGHCASSGLSLCYTRLMFLVAVWIHWARRAQWAFPNTHVICPLPYPMQRPIHSSVMSRPLEILT